MTNIASHTAGSKTTRPTHQFKLGGVEYTARLPKLAHWQALNTQLTALPKNPDGTPVITMETITLLDSIFLAMVDAETAQAVQARMMDVNEDLDLAEKYQVVNDLLRHFTPLMKKAYQGLGLRETPPAKLVAAPADRLPAKKAAAKAPAPAKKAAAKKPAKRAAK